MTACLFIAPSNLQCSTYIISYLNHLVMKIKENFHTMEAKLGDNNYF